MTMKSLSELVRLVTTYHLNKVAFFNFYNKNDKDTLYYKFMDGLNNEEIKTDEDAAFLLYGEKENNVRYRVLKNRLKERLYNNILFLETGRRASSSYATAFQSTYRMMVVAVSLISEGARTAGFELLNNVYKKALKYELHHIVELCALYLRRENLLLGNRENLENYTQIFKEASDKMLEEANAEELYRNIAIHFKSVNPKKEDVISIAKTNMDKIIKISKKYNTYQIKYYEYSIKSIYYQLINDFNAALKENERFEKYLIANNVFYSKARHGSIAITKLSCYLYLGQFKKGLIEAEKSLDFFAVGTVNWFIVQEIYFLLAFNNEDFNLATEIYCQAVESRRFDSLSPLQIEIWKIYGGYLWFMLKYKKKDALLNVLKDHKHSFRFGKLINEIPLFSKDKQGMNVAVLILQILLLLQEKDYISITQRTVALKSYINRNLSKKQSKRSYCFIKMLLVSENTSFDKKNTERKSAKFLEQMMQEEKDYLFEQDSRIEIIPYEKLWKIVLKQLS